jgi:hypothetical protein
MEGKMEGKMEGLDIDLDCFVLSLNFSLCPLCLCVLCVLCADLRVFRSSNG